MKNANQLAFFGRVARVGLAVCWGALLSLGNAAAGGATSGQTLPDPSATNNATGKVLEYRIQPLDTLQITVFHEPDLSMKLRVSSQGAINYPMLGVVVVGGLTGPEAEKKLTELLGQGYLVRPSVTVGVENMSRRRVVVLGQVKAPGTLEIGVDEVLTLVQAIGRVGGFTDFAAKDNITIIRHSNGKEEKMVVNVAAIIKGGNRALDVELKADDVVSVPAAMF